MTKLETLNALRERLEKATGQLDDDLLGRIICACCNKRFGTTGIATGDDGNDEFQVYEAGQLSELPYFADYRHHCPDVSVDAALALVTQCLPGFCVDTIGRTSGGYVGAMKTLAWTAEISNGDAEYNESGLTIPLAILSALMGALIAQEQAS